MKNDENTIREKLARLLEGSPEKDLFFEFLDRSGADDLGEFVGHIDDSDYSLQDWVKAFLGFDDWLTERGISVRCFVDMLGYLHCCQMAIPETLERPDLQSFVVQCLNDYGFDAAQNSQ